MELCDVILRTNRVRCALNMEILDLLNEESVSTFEKVSRSLKYDSNIFFDHRYIYIYMDTTTDHFTPLALHVRGNKDWTDSNS